MTLQLQLTRKPATDARPVAQLANVSGTYIGFIERGDNVPSLTIVLQIAAALRIRVADLLRDS